MKNLQPVTRNLAGNAIEVTPFPARYALTYKFKILQIFGSPVIDFIKGPLAGLIEQKQVAGELTIDNIDTSIFESLNSDLFGKVDPDKATGLIFDLLSSTTVNKKPLTEEGITELFTKNLTTLYKVLFIVLEVNYKDFLSLAGTTSPQGISDDQNQDG